jgi:hypothetical protein
MKLRWLIIILLSVGAWSQTPAPAPPVAKPVSEMTRLRMLNSYRRAMLAQAALS